MAFLLLRWHFMALESSEAPDASATPTSYEHILLSIGIGLDALGVQAFDLKVNDNKYIVEGESEPKKIEERPTPSASGNPVRNFWNRFKAQLSPGISGRKSPFVFLGMQFTRNDIKRLDRQGRELGSLWEEVPDFRRMPQILRTIGAYVDQKSGCLLKVSRHVQTVTLCFKDVSGREHREEFAPANLYDFWVNVYLRKTKPH